jgi:hypothetical protein
MIVCSRCINHELIVVKDARLYFVPNDIELAATQSLRRDWRRQLADVFCLLKQEGSAGAERAAKNIPLLDASNALCSHYYTELPDIISDSHGISD